jgi:hypothetical protein
MDFMIKGPDDIEVVDDEAIRIHVALDVPVLVGLTPQEFLAKSRHQQLKLLAELLAAEMAEFAEHPDLLELHIDRIC